jgi:hypothetical protein
VGVEGRGGEWEGRGEEWEASVSHHAVATM